ncbi:LAMI_0G08504g1_1 [Lachancea mirantina]|uniref:LAMI_0G08504g1_1 n=1 Tax=Lachancea mirantina TaxID=1230905 RepID=A0A1G4K9Z4_9SACH|nr:LAMI_0G08504g1_1 [Lachancea mirantina]
MIFEHSEFGMLSGTQGWTQGLKQELTQGGMSQLSFEGQSNQMQDILDLVITDPLHVTSEFSSLAVGGDIHSRSVPVEEMVTVNVTDLLLEPEGGNKTLVGPMEFMHHVNRDLSRDFEKNSDDHNSMLAGNQLLRPSLKTRKSNPFYSPPKHIRKMIVKERSKKPESRRQSSSRSAQAIDSMSQAMYPARPGELTLKRRETIG